MQLDIVYFFVQVVDKRESRPLFIGCVLEYRMHSWHLYN